MLDWWAKLLKEAGITEILVNTHYLHEQVHTYIEEFNSKNTGVIFREFYEEELLGSGGTVRANQDFVFERQTTVNLDRKMFSDDAPFLICYADNLCNVNLRELITFHQQKKGILTMALFRTNHPEQCGIAELDSDGRIIEFTEKPERPKSNLANAGIYVANGKLFEYFPEKEFVDFGKDILPKLVGEMYGWETRDYLIDIGTMDNYERAKKEWQYDYYKDTLTH